MRLSRLLPSCLAVSKIKNQESRIINLPLFLLAFAPFALFAKADYASLLPPSADLYLEVGSFQKLDSLGSFPLFKPFQAQELKTFFAPLLKKIEAESNEVATKILAEETGLSEKELDACFPHGFAFSIYDLKIQPSEDIAWSLEGAILTEFKGDEALAAKILSGIGKVAQHQRAELEKKAAKNKNAADADSEETDEDERPSARFPEDYVETKADYKGTSLHLWKLKPEAHDILDQFAWAIQDGVLIFSSAENEIKTLIDRAKSGSTKDTLAGSASHRAVLDRAGTSDILVSTDLSGLIAQGLAKLAEATAAKPKANEFNPQKLIEALGLSEFRNLFVSMSFAEEQADLAYGLTYAKKPGLFSLFAFGPGAGPAPAFIPADASAASYGRFDLSAMVTNLEKMIAEVYPPAGIIVSGQLAQLKAATTVDLKADLLANLDKEMFTIAEPRPATTNVDEADEDSENPFQSLGQQNQVIAFKLKDRNAFELALKSLINGLAPDKSLFETRDYLGFTIQLVKSSEDGPMPFSYVLTDDYLLLNIGQPVLLEKLLARISKKATDGLFSTPSLAAALKTLPDANVTSAGYQDLDSLMQMGIEAIAKIAEKADDEAMSEIIDTKNVPKNLKFPLYFISKAYLDDNAMVIRARMLLKP